MIFILLTALASAWPIGLNDYGIKTSGKIRVIKEQKMMGTKSQHVLELEVPDSQRIEVRIISPVTPEAARQMIDTERGSLQNLYSAPQTPYMGDIAQAIGGCSRAFGPKSASLSILGHDARVLLGGVSDSRAFGACAKDKAKLMGAFWAYYDSSTQSVWSWRAYTPWTSSAALNSTWLKPLAALFRQ